jgi:hypothetical protein
MFKPMNRITHFLNLQVVSWIPVHTAAACLVKMRQSETLVLHLVHPNPVPWSTVLEPISEALGMPLVPYSVWLSALKACSLGKHSGPASAHNPALHLLDFFQSADKPLPSPDAEAFGFPRLLTEKAAKVAFSLKYESLSVLGKQDAEGWLKYWTKIGHLHHV